jgi:hypothetical protein
MSRSMYGMSTAFNGSAASLLYFSAKLYDNETMRTLITKHLLLKTLKSWTIFVNDGIILSCLCIYCYRILEYKRWSVITGYSSEGIIPRGVLCRICTKSRGKQAPNCMFKVCFLHFAILCASLLQFRRKAEL